jgi:hypothetical protein
VSNRNLGNDALLRGLTAGKIENIPLDPIADELNEALSLLTRLSGLFKMGYGKSLLRKRHLIFFYKLHKLADNNYYQLLAYIAKEEAP